MNGKDFCIKKTYSVIKTKYRKIDWHLLTKYGDSLLVVVDNPMAVALTRQSACRFRKQTGLNLKLVCKTKSYLLYELRPDEK